ncbi:GDSL esterase/lipase At5g03610-like [Silene latifolia]|uniref:GDSL esterase/lipase At5g03610-like n=1 Tax=Silene latifolia TaxID=37657 RepID=UPI003D7704A3
MEAALRVVRYLKGSPGQGVLLRSNSQLSVSGDSPVSWKTKKQHIVTLSSAEAEYRSMAALVCELKWLKGLLAIQYQLNSIFLNIGVGVVQCSNHHHHHGPKKLFVFGDSYADTGNDRNPDAKSWKEPYGITFPGKPSGRFSDGRVFTDFLAKSLKLKSPIPYIRRNRRNSHLRYGMNLAYGGTGVFDTKMPYPNMTTQINMFQQLLNQSIFTPQDLQHSIAYVSLVGNDYTNYLANGGTAQGLQTFIPKVVNQLVLNIERIYKMGVKKILVTGLQPLGCLPHSTYPSLYKKCDNASNTATQFHNLLLQKSVLKLNNMTANGSTSFPFVTIDLYKAFSSIIQPPIAEQKKSVFKNLLVPCCTGLNSTYDCGSVDANFKKMYTVCSDPKSYFFWDSSHPTQAGWEALTLSLQSIIQQLR